MYAIALVHTVLLVLFLTLPVSASNQYPEWFLYPKKYPKFITGFTYNESSEKIDAEIMSCVYRECIVYGTLEIFQNSGEEYLKNSDYYYYYSPDSLSTIRGHLYPVDRFCISTLNDEYVTLFAEDSTVQVSAPRLEIEQIPVPQWLEKDFFEDDTYYYGIGIYTSLGREADAWKTAEEHAIFNIITNLAVQIHSLQLVLQDENQGDAVEKVAFLKVKYLLRNIQVLERYPDRRNQLFFVLVRIAKKDVVSPLLQKD